MRYSVFRAPALVFLAAVLFLPGCTSSGSPPAAQVDLVIDHVLIVDVRSGDIAANQAIVIADGKIVRIESAGQRRPDGATRVVDGQGAFVVPGFNDMHAHNLNTASPETSLPLMLANGITGFRQMAGAPALLSGRAAGAMLLPEDSPALLGMPGTILIGPAFSGLNQVAEAIAAQKAQGADFIKVVDLPPAAFLAAADAAYADGLQFSGHLPPTVRPRDAITYHVSSIEHLGPGISLLLACSSDEEPIRQILAAIPASASDLDFDVPPEKLQRQLANPMMLTPPAGFEMMRRVLATYDGTKCQSVARDLAASGVWIVPTLTRLEAMTLGNSASLRDNPDLAYVPAAARQLWLDVGDDFEAKLTTEQHQVLADLYARQLTLAKLLDDNGVKMLAGTDFGGQWIVSGFSLHHEFDLLAGAGLSPLRVLQMATLNPALYLGREDSMGTVEPGKNADLVLLGGGLPLRGGPPDLLARRFQGSSVHAATSP